MEKGGYVYILGNRSGSLYIGVTNNLERRLSEHKDGLVEGFTQRYRIDQLLYYEVFDDIRDAIAREKQLKGWRCSKKTALIERENPGYIDLSEEWHNLPSPDALQDVS